MDTRVTFNKKTGEMTTDVLDGVGTQCQEQNAKVYERLRRELGLPEDAIREVCKPEFYAMAEAATDEERLEG